MPKKRFRKLELTDLVEKQLKPKDASHINNQMCQTESLINTNAKSQQQLATQQLLTELISKIGTVHSMLQLESHQGMGLQNHLNSLQCTSHQESPKVEIESPIPSPKHELNLEYLGNLMLTEEHSDEKFTSKSLQYESFHDDDDF